MSAKWSDPGSTYDSYVVQPEVSDEIYYKSEYMTLFGGINDRREVTEQELSYSNGTKTKIDAGNNSPVWEKGSFDARTGECRFTLLEETTGMATYGEADVKPGNFDDYKHSNCYVRQVDTEAYPIPGSESEYNIKPVIRDLVKTKKDGITRWRAKEVDLDAFRACFMGASRGLLLTEDGGKGIKLYGGTAGQARSPYNTYVSGQTGLTTPSAVLATHNSNLATALATLSDDDAFAFTYGQHQIADSMIDKLGGQPVSFGGQEYRAIAIIDERNIKRMMSVGGTLSNLFRDATVRGDKNKSLYSRQKIVLDDICYIPARQMDYFRPSVVGADVVYGCGNTYDPRLKTFVNASNITMTMYLMAGALLRGRRKGAFFTEGLGAHGKGRSYAFHYHDGWTRHDWFTDDGRTEMMNDSMLVMYNYDPGVGVAYAK